VPPEHDLFSIQPRTPNHQNLRLWNSDGQGTCMTILDGGSVLQLYHALYAVRSAFLMTATLLFDRAFSVAAARLWTVFHRSSLLPSLSLSIFCCRIKSHLFSLSYPAF